MWEGPWVRSRYRCFFLRLGVSITRDVEWSTGYVDLVHYLRYCESFFCSRYTLLAVFNIGSWIGVALIPRIQEEIIGISTPWLLRIWESWSRVEEEELSSKREQWMIKAIVIKSNEGEALAIRARESFTWIGKWIAISISFWSEVDFLAR